MIPLIQNVVLVLYPQEKRGFIMGIIGLVIAFGPALGPTVGGWIIYIYSEFMAFPYFRLD